MAIELNCIHKDCGKFQQPELDTKTNIVYCSICGKDQNASHFLKMQLKAVGQVKAAKKFAFSVKCQNCKTEALPLLDKKQLICPKCKAIHTGIPAPFANIIKEHLKSKGKDDND